MNNRKAAIHRLYNDKRTPTTYRRYLLLDFISRKWLPSFLKNFLRRFSTEQAVRKDEPDCRHYPFIEQKFNFQPRIFTMEIFSPHNLVLIKACTTQPLFLCFCLRRTKLSYIRTQHHMQQMRVSTSHTEDV